jgi:malonyl-CoA/methylmalonyl-CoA synthetase
MNPSLIDPVLWIETIAAQDPDRLWLTDDTAHGYGALNDAMRAMAGRLAALGVVAGDRVAVQVEKSREALELYLGCLWLGAIYMPFNSGYTDAEIGWFLRDAEPALFVVDPGSHHLVRADVRALALDELIAVTPTAPGVRPVFDRDVQAAMLYTSGTTGKPKGAMLTRGNLASSAATLVDAWRFTADDVLIHALPIFHVHGLFVATNTVLAAGASMLFMEKFDADGVIDRFDRGTVLMGVPTFYTRLLSNPRLSREACQSMRLFVSGSAPLLAETHRDFEARTGHAILERYGMTETMMNTSNPYDGTRIPGTVGPPLPGVSVRVTDAETGAMLPQGDIGMIEVKGPNLFKGYWRNPEKTAAEHRADGYFITGDLGKIDDAGYIHIIGRGKDLIITGGFNVYPKEVEDAIDALPGVLESAVVGLPHPDFGEAVTAVVVAKPGVVLDAVVMKAMLAKSLAKFKLPKAIHVVAELPRNTMGKVQKALLREQFG